MNLVSPKPLWCGILSVTAKNYADGSVSVLALANLGRNLYWQVRVS